MLLSEICDDESMAECFEKIPGEVWVGCGDRRINEELDRLADEEHKSHMVDIFTPRNAAGNIKSLPKTIERHIRENLKEDGTCNIQKLKIIGHTKCGALDIVFDVLTGKMQVDIQLREVLINQYKDFKVNLELSREENLRVLEKFHLEKQEENARQLLDYIQTKTGINTSGIIIESMLIDTDAVDKTESQPDYKNMRYVVVVDTPLKNKKFTGVVDQIRNTDRCCNKYTTYFFNVDPEDCATGLQIFARLGAEKFYVSYEEKIDNARKDGLSVEMLQRVMQVRSSVSQVNKDSQVIPIKTEGLHESNLQSYRISSAIKTKVH